MFRLSMMYKNVTFLLVISFVFSAVSATETMKGDNKHVRVWNKFANDSLSLHKKLTDGKNYEVKKTIGSYANIKDFYIEYRYFNKGKLVSQVQWEKDDPTTLHTIEVFVHDNKGRVVRDFVAAYLPFYHNAPTQTLASFHHYTGNLHAFRSFDATGDKILERCTGKDEKGQSVNFILDEDDLYNDPDEIIGSKEYNNCFSGLKQEKLGKYIIPQ
ncbi:MAG: hypothetical protein BMS9Abin31_0366 [Gammaproteobacteria bacterium]|nr:MAG: hypothetical protein BMS9Abin31_0366 [Gammaproteobacteria bacterium]